MYVLRFRFYRKYRIEEYKKWLCSVCSKILQLSGSQDVNFPMKEEAEEVNSCVVCAFCEVSMQVYM